ncbi:MAG: septal ring lytic transglycosylase RlpA family protein [Actinomycetota bacterium]
MEGRHTTRSTTRGILAALLASSLLLIASAPPANTEPGEGSAVRTYGKVKSPGKKWSKVYPAKKAKKIATKRTTKQLKKAKKHGGKVKVRLKLFDRYTFWGEASTYSAGLDGGPTACGGPYDHQAMTAAHKTLACGTKVVVTNPSTGKTITVTINDRGPFVPGRVIDLSGKAWSKLTGGASPGVMHVHARVK